MCWSVWEVCGLVGLNTQNTPRCLIFVLHTVRWSHLLFALISIFPVLIWFRLNLFYVCNLIPTILRTVNPTCTMIWLGCEHGLDGLCVMSPIENAFTSGSSNRKPIQLLFFRDTSTSLSQSTVIGPSGPSQRFYVANQE